MKTILAGAVALAASLTFSQAADYSVFRVCEDQHVLKTSDGADAGHVEYIVVDPAEQRVVSTIITGGVLAERSVAVPVTSLQFGTEREVVIREITRERLVSAPVIEQTQITQINSGRFEPAFVERSYQHFGADASFRRTSVNVNVNNREVNRTSEVNRTNIDASRTVNNPADPRTVADADRDGRPDARREDRNRDGRDHRDNREERRDRQATADAQRDAAARNAQTDAAKKDQTQRNANNARPYTEDAERAGKAPSAERTAKAPGQDATTAEKQPSPASTREPGSEKRERPAAAPGAPEGRERTAPGESRRGANEGGAAERNAGAGADRPAGAGANRPAGGGAERPAAGGAERPAGAGAERNGGGRNNN